MKKQGISQIIIVLILQAVILNACPRGVERFFIPRNGPIPAACDRLSPSLSLNKINLTRLYERPEPSDLPEPRWPKEKLKEYLSIGENPLTPEIIKSVFTHWQRHLSAHLPRSDAAIEGVAWEKDFCRDANIFEIYLHEFLRWTQELGPDNAITFLRQMGCTAVWFPPFYDTPPAPYDDHGYAVKNYKAYHRELVLEFGEDFIDKVFEKLKKSNIGIVIDFPLYHASIQHPLVMAEANPFDPLYPSLRAHRLMPKDAFRMGAPDFESVVEALIQRGIIGEFYADKRYVYFKDGITEQSIREKITEPWAQEVTEKYHASFRGRISPGIADEYVKSSREKLIEKGIFLRVEREGRGAEYLDFNPAFRTEEELLAKLESVEGLSGDLRDDIRQLWLLSGRETYFIWTHDPHKFHARFPVTEMRKTLSAQSDKAVTHLKLLKENGIVQDDNFDGRYFVWCSALPENRGFAEITAQLDLEPETVQKLVKFFLRWDEEHIMKRNDFFETIGLRGSAAQDTVEQLKKEMHVLDILQKNGIIKVDRENPGSIIWLNQVSGDQEGFAERLKKIINKEIDLPVDGLIELWARTHHTTRVIFSSHEAGNWSPHPVRSAIRKIWLRYLEHFQKLLQREWGEDKYAQEYTRTVQGISYEFEAEYRWNNRQRKVSAEEIKKEISGRINSLLEAEWGKSSLGGLMGGKKTPVYDAEFLRANGQETLLELQEKTEEYFIGGIKEYYEKNLYDIHAVYYMHRFYHYQAGWNWHNPEVMDLMVDLAGFWIKKGVVGFRLDAVPYLAVQEYTNNENTPKTLALVRELIARIRREHQDVFAWVEANQPIEKLADYLNAGDNIMAYAFLVMAALYIQPALVHAKARGEDIPDYLEGSFFEYERQVSALHEALRKAGVIDAVIALFVQVHDEVTLEMLPDLVRKFFLEYFKRDIPVIAEGKQPAVINTRANLQGISDTLMGLCLRIVSGKDDFEKLSGKDRLNARRLFNTIKRLAGAVRGANVSYYRGILGLLPDTSLIGKIYRQVFHEVMGEEEEGAGDTAEGAKIAAGDAVAKSDTRLLLRGPVEVKEILLQMLDENSPLMQEALTNRLRQMSPMITRGEDVLLRTGNPALIGHVRKSGEKSYLLLHNVGPEPQKFRFDASLIKGSPMEIFKLEELFGGKGGLKQVSPDGYIEVDIGPYSSQWLAVKKVVKVIIDNPSAAEANKLKTVRGALNLALGKRGLEIKENIKEFIAILFGEDPEEQASEEGRGKPGILEPIAVLDQNAAEKLIVSCLKLTVLVTHEYEGGKEGVGKYIVREWLARIFRAYYLNPVYRRLIRDILLYMHQMPDDKFSAGYKAEVQNALYQMEAGEIIQKSADILEQIEKIIKDNSGMEDEILSSILQDVKEKLENYKNKADSFAGFDTKYNPGELFESALALENAFKSLRKPLEVQEGLRDQTLKILDGFLRDFFSIQSIKMTPGSGEVTELYLGDPLEVSAEVSIPSFIPIRHGEEASDFVVEDRVKAEILYSMVDDEGRWLKPEPAEMEFSGLNNDGTAYFFKAKLTPPFEGTYHFIARVSLNGNPPRYVTQRIKERPAGNPEGNGVCIVKSPGENKVFLPAPWPVSGLPIEEINRSI